MTWEIGLESSFRQDNFVTSTNETITNRLWRVDLNVFWVPNRHWQLGVRTPFVSNFLQRNDNRWKRNGIGQIILSSKHAFSSTFGSSVQVELPTGNQDDLLSEGLNVGFTLLTKKEKVYSDVYGYFNLGFIYKSEFETNFGLADFAKVKVNPGEVIFAGFVLERKVNNFELTSEVYVARVANAQLEGITVDNSGGHVIDLGVGVTKRYKNHWKLKLGGAIGIGDEEVTSFDFTRPAGDGRIFLSSSYHF